MKIDFLIFSNKDFLPKALVSKKSFDRFYLTGDNKVEIVIYEAPKVGAHLQGLAKYRIEVVRDRLENHEAVVMLGADCVLYNNIDFLLSMPGKIVLVPHVVKPPPHSARFYRGGHVNGDVVCFRNNSIDIVDWLLTQPMREDLNKGMFFEQTLLSSVPFFFEGVAICRDPTVNYAYYNFHERPLEKNGDSFFINAKPLALCQFSGYIDGSPEKISRYYKGPTPSANVLDLFREYEQAIAAEKLRQGESIQAESYNKLVRIPNDGKA